MGTYRNDNIDEQMCNIGLCLTSIVAQELDNLGVGDILAENRKDNPEMPFEEAVKQGMQQNANEALIRISAMAICFDRCTVMVEQMVADMKKDGLVKTAERYEKRLEVLTDVDHAIKEIGK